MSENKVERAALTDASSVLFNNLADNARSRLGQIDFDRPALTTVDLATKEIGIIFLGWIDYHHVLVVAGSEGGGFWPVGICFGSFRFHAIIQRQLTGTPVTAVHEQEVEFG